MKERERDTEIEREKEIDNGVGGRERMKPSLQGERHRL